MHVMACTRLLAEIEGPRGAPLPEVARRSREKGWPVRTIPMFARVQAKGQLWFIRPVPTPGRSFVPPAPLTEQLVDRLMRPSASKA